MKRTLIALLVLVAGILVSAGSCGDRHCDSMPKFKLSALELPQIPVPRPPPPPPRVPIRPIIVIPPPVHYHGHC